MRDAATPSFGLALSGGTARGLAHIGVLDVLERAELRPAAISGSSFGAVVAAAYALGMSPRAFADFTQGQNMPRLWSLALDFGLHRASLIHGARLERWLEQTIFQGATFTDAKVPLAIACTALETGEPVVLREGSIARAVRASCALPGIFAPVEIGGQHLVDGGFVSPVPFAPLHALGARVRIGVQAGIDADRAFLVGAVRRFHHSSAGRYAYRTFTTAPWRNTWATLGRGLVRAAASYSQPPVYPPDALLIRVNPPLAWWDFHKAAAAIAAGREAMTLALPELRALLHGARADVAPLPL